MRFVSSATAAASGEADAGETGETGLTSPLPGLTLQEAVAALPEVRMPTLELAKEEKVSLVSAERRDLASSNTGLRTNGQVRRPRQD